MASEQRDTRIPYRLGTDQYCKFEGRDEYVHMGDLVAVNRWTTPGFVSAVGYLGRLCGVEYDAEGSICGVSLLFPNENYGYRVDFDGVFHHAKVVTDD